MYADTCQDREKQKDGADQILGWIWIQKTDSPDCLHRQKDWASLLWSWLISFELCFFFFISKINLNAVWFISVEDQIKSSSIWLMIMVFMSAYMSERDLAGEISNSLGFQCGTPWKWYILSVCERTWTLPSVFSNLLQFLSDGLLCPFLKVRLIRSSIRLLSVLLNSAVTSGVCHPRPLVSPTAFIYHTLFLSKSISPVSCKCSVWIVP